MGNEFRFGGHGGGTATSIAYTNTVIHIPARMPESGFHPPPDGMALDGFSSLAVSPVALGVCAFHYLRWL
jgi:hypothetical protein